LRPGFFLALLDGVDGSSLQVSSRVASKSSLSSGTGSSISASFSASSNKELCCDCSLDGAKRFILDKRKASAKISGNGLNLCLA